MNRIIVVFLLLTPTLSVSLLEADEAQEAAILQLLDNGGAVRNMAANDDRLIVDFHLSPDSFKDDLLATVAKLSNVYELHLGGTPLTDAGLHT